MEAIKEAAGLSLVVGVIFCTAVALPMVVSDESAGERSFGKVEEFWCLCTTYSGIGKALSAPNQNRGIKRTSNRQ